MIEKAYAMAPPAGQDATAADTFMSFLPLIAIFVIFYFLLIRPQHKKQKEQQAMLGALKEGDAIITSGGIHGSIVKIKDNVLTVQIAENVKIKIDRNYVASLKSQS